MGKDKKKKQPTSEKVEADIKKSGLFSTLDNIDASEINESRLERERLEKAQKSKKTKAEKMSMGDFKKKIEELHERRQVYYDAGGYVDAINISEEIIEFAKKGNLILIIKEEEEEIKNLKNLLKEKEEAVEGDIFSKLDSIDAEAQEESRLKSIRLAESERFDKEKQKEKEAQMSIMQIKQKLEELESLKQEYSNKENFPEAIKVAEEIINFGTKAKMTTIVEKNEEFIDQTRRRKPAKVTEQDKIRGLREIKENHIVMGDYQKAIEVVEKIIEIAKSANLIPIITEEVKALEDIKKKMKKSLSKTDIKTKIEGLREVKHGYYDNKDYKKAIEISERIIELAKQAKLKEILKEEEDSITNMQGIVEKEPSKMEIIDQIETLKGVKQEHITRGEINKAIKVGQQIIKFAKLADKNSLVLEEQESIEKLHDLLDKKSQVSRFEDELILVNDNFDGLINQARFEEAHKMVTTFQEKYKDNTDINVVEDIQALVLKEKKILLSFEMKQKELDRLEQERIAKEQEKLAHEQTPTAISQEQEELSVAKQSFEQVKSILEAQKQELEEEYANLEQEKAELAEVKKSFETVKQILEQQKIDLESGYEALALERTEFEEKKKRYDEQLGNQLDQKDQAFVQERAKFEAEKLEWQKQIIMFNEEKKKFDLEKSELEEKKKF